MKLGNDVDRVDPTSCLEVIGECPIVDRLVHADVKRFLDSAGVIEGRNNGFDKIFHVHKVALNGLAAFVEHDRDGSFFDVFISFARVYVFTPTWTAEDVFSK